MRYILWFKESWPPSLFAFITLITYQFSLLPFACLACLCASLCSRTLVSPLTLPGVLTYQHTWFCLLRFFVPTRTNHFLSYYFLPKFFFFSISPPPPCLVSHFSLFTLLFTLPDFLQQLASPACLHFSLLCQRTCLFAAVRVSWTEGVLCSVCYSSWG